MQYVSPVLQDHHTLPMLKLLKISSFKTNTPSQSMNSYKISSFNTTTPSKVETVKNQFFQDYHTTSKVETMKVSSFKTTIPSQSRNCQILFYI